MTEETSQTPPWQSTGRGLFDGFEGYVTPSDDDYDRFLTAGLVVADANVLLDLYRYNAATQKDLFEVLKRLGNRLWIPHQALQEFWRNRESALRDPRDTVERTLESLNELCRQATESIHAWANRIALTAERRASLIDALHAAFKNATETVSGYTKLHTAEHARDTSQDAVLATLAPILSGKVGPPFETTEFAEMVKEGLRRVQAGIPPGYKDKAKGDDLAAGDYLLWEQVLREASQRRVDVVFVTSDVKEDWWRKERGETRGPRLELADEMRNRAGSRLYMLRPESLLVHAARVLKVNIRNESVQDAERVERERVPSASAAPIHETSSNTLIEEWRSLLEHARDRRDWIEYDGELEVDMGDLWGNGRPEIAPAALAGPVSVARVEPRWFELGFPLAHQGGITMVRIPFTFVEDLWPGSEGRLHFTLRKRIRFGRGKSTFV